jgi:hypothetical protein
MEENRWMIHKSLEEDERKSENMNWNMWGVFTIVKSCAVTIKN